MLVRRFAEALRLVEKLDKNAASEDSSSIRGVFSVTHLDSALLPKAVEQDVLLYIKAAAS